MKLNKNTILIFVLLFLSYVLGYLCYLPFWTVLIISAIFQILIWMKLAVIIEQIDSIKISNCFNILCFYKMFLSIIGYSLIYVDIISPFNELNNNLIAFIFITQVKPFEFKILTLVDSFESVLSSLNNPGVVIEIVISVLSSVIIIFSYYFTKITIRQKNKKGHFLRVEKIN